MYIRKKWILALCCICLACIMSATTIGCAFNGVVEDSANLSAPTAKLENVTGQYDVSKLATANFNDSVTALDTTQTEVSVIVDLGGHGLYDIYDKSESFDKFVASPRAVKYYKTITKQQNAFISALQKSGIEYTYRGAYSSVSNAVAIRISSSDFYKLGSIQGVKRVYRNEIYAIPEAVIDPVTNFTPVYSTGVYDSSESGYDGSGMLVAVLDTGLDYTHQAFNEEDLTAETAWNKDKIASLFVKNNSEDNIPLHSQTLGYSVDDVYVNKKVPYAFDYADDDPDVYPSYSNHGTHVAGIIAGRDDTKQVDAEGNTFIGVAPNAQLAIMKVFTDNLESKMLGGADSIDILHAIDDCAKLGVDVINMSLGSAGGFSDYASDEYVTSVYKLIQDIGISLIVAAGNEFSSGYGGGNGTNLASNPDSGTVGSPSTYEASLSVASIEGQKSPFLIGNESTNASVAFITNSSDAYGNELDFIELLYQQVEKWYNYPIGSLSRDEPLNLPYVIIGGVGSRGNYTSVIRRQLSSQPTIALIKRGDISFADKVTFAKEYGAVGCVIYNHLSGTIRMSLGDVQDPIPACSIGLEAGTTLVNNAVSNKGMVTISKDYTAGPFMSEFSSWGPTPSLKLKPEITAYGGKILSAIPGGYDQQSGTSMAAPNMSGMVALMRQYVGKLTREEGNELFGADLNARVYQMLMSTTTMVNNEEGNPYSPRKQGAGLGNLASALSTSAYITVDQKDEGGNVIGQLSKTKIELFDDPNRSGLYAMEFTVHNIKDSAITYTPHVYTMTETLAIDKRTVAEKPYMLNDTDVKVYVGDSLVGETITVPAKSSLKVKVTLSLGEEGRKYIEDSFKNGMYVEGFVRFENGSNANGDEICDIGVPYLAFYGDWADAPMFDYDMYEISENENDSSVEPEDKIHASASATTPLGMYEEKYIIPLGSYVYTMDDKDVAITSSDDRAAISIYNEDYGPTRTINEFYGVYAGLLRGAKEMDLSIIDTVTGEVVYQELLHNQRKSYAGGGNNIGSPVTLQINPYVWDWNNNTQYEMKLTGRLDWTDENGELISPEKNTFSFKFTVDYEAPTITDYRVRYVPYTENKETKYRIYMDVDVYDNQYSMALLPCFMDQSSDSRELNSLARYPIPIYSQKNQVTTVSFEITDYYEDYFLKGNFFLYPMDYAMNHSLYRVTPNDSIDYPQEIEFQEVLPNKFVKTVVETDSSNNPYQCYRLALAPNEVFKLVQIGISPEGTVNHKLKWTSTNESVQAKEGEIYAGSVRGSSTLQLLAGNRVLAKIIVNVRENADEQYSAPRLQAIDFRPVYNGDRYVAPVDQASYLSLNNNTQTQLVIDTTPWYYGEVELQWTSNNENIATVSQEGVVSTHRTGTTWITATAVGVSNVSASIQVVVGSNYDVRNYRLYEYYGGEVAEIPEELNIMYLDDECFRGNTTIRKVVLPETLTEIPEGAFLNCTNLEEVVIPASCHSVLNYAFQGCTKLKKISLSKFKNKIDGDWEEYTIGSLTLGIGAFLECTSLTTIENSTRITTLGDAAFYGCTALKEIDISGLRVTGIQVFGRCTSLENVTMSEQTKLGEGMFIYCTKLNNVTLKSQIIPMGLFAACTSLTNVTFDPEIKVTSIGDLAFLNCIALEEITLPNGEYSIGIEVFNNCQNLSTVNLSKDTHITNALTVPFSACPSFSAINVASGNQYYASHEDTPGILYDSEMTTILLVPTLAEIDLTSLPDGVTNIGPSALVSNKYITSINLGDFQSIGEYAFADSNIKNVTIPSDWTKIPNGLFYGSEALQSVSFAEGSNLLTVGDEAFASCSMLSSITLPNSVTEIGDAAFRNCSKLTSLYSGNRFPNVQRIGAYALSGTGLSRIIAENVTEIGDHAFASMNNLTSAEFGAVTSMGVGIFSDITTDSNDEEVLVGNGGLQSVKFAHGTTVIGAYAFANANLNGHLTTVELPSTVKTIGDYAFLNRAELTSINLESVETIGDQAFINCRALTSVDLSSVTSIGIAAFAFTKSLQSANLANVEVISGSAFEGSGITTLTIPKAAIIGSFAFAETKLETIEIPSTLNTYKHEETDFTRINDAGDVETVNGKMALSIMNGAFMFIPTLQQFTIEGNTNETYFVDDGVLYARTANGYVLVQYPSGKQAESYEVLEGTVRIGDYAFYGDTNLQEITFPVSLQSIGAFAFYNDNTDGTFTRNYIFKAVEAPVLETILATSQEYLGTNENYLVFYGDNNRNLSIFSNIFYANFGNFAALVIEERHVMAQIQWLKDQNQSTAGYTYKAPVYNYSVTYPVNGRGYDTPIWKAYFNQNVTNSAYSADRTTANAINKIQAIKSADEIKEQIDAISGNEQKLAALNEISSTYLKEARDAYNLILEAGQQALVSDYGNLLASEKMVRDLKSQLGVKVAVKELKREGNYKTRYTEGESFDPQDMRIIAVYEDGSMENLSSNDYMLNKTGALVPSDTNVVVSYGGKSLTLGIAVTAIQPDSYTVTFVGEGVTTSTQTVNSGSTATEPAKPQREGYTFKYWYAQDANQAFDFNTVITSDVTLTAAWQEVTDNPYNPNNPPETPVGLIVGLSVGGAVVLAGVAVLVVLLLRKKKLANSSSQPVQTPDKNKSSDTDETNKAE